MVQNKSNFFINHVCTVLKTFGDIILLDCTESVTLLHLATSKISFFILFPGASMDSIPQQLMVWITM